MRSRSTHQRSTLFHRSTRATRPALRRGLAIGALCLAAATAAPAALAATGALTSPISALSGVPAEAPAAVPIPAVEAIAAEVPAAVPAGIAAVTPATVRAARQAEFLSFTTASAETLDRRGIEPSLYRGAFFSPRVEEKRLCIIRRESEGFYDVRGGGGNRYYGAYQMNDDLADGATWMMLPEAKQLVGESAAKALMAKLRAKPVNTWPRYWQDAAFFTIYNYEGTGSGRFHWAGGRWSC